jgi:hypothetical protein
VWSLCVCFSKQVGYGCILFNITALLLICRFWLLILCGCVLSGLCSQDSGKWVMKVCAVSDLFVSLLSILRV